MTEKSTKDKILDAAEAQFARHGFDGVSARDIARSASVDPALVNYHFGNKRAVFDAVMLRRAEVLNNERQQALDFVLRRHHPNPAPLDEIIDAFTHALLNRAQTGGQEWRDYFALLGQINNTPEFGGSIMTQFFDPLVHRFLDALRATLPEADEADLMWCYHFLSGALTLTFAATGRIDSLSNGLCKSTDFDEVHKRLVPFICAGFRSMCGPEAGPIQES